jgi:hypothetical protein
MRTKRCLSHTSGRCLFESWIRTHAIQSYYRTENQSVLHWAHSIAWRPRRRAVWKSFSRFGDNTGVIDFPADLFFNAFADSERSVACCGII